MPNANKHLNRFLLSLGVLVALSGAKRMAEKRDALLMALQATQKWKVNGSPVWSRFDPPFMPWFLRRNEVQIEVSAK